MRRTSSIVRGTPSAECPDFTMSSDSTGSMCAAVGDGSIISLGGRTVALDGDDGVDVDAGRDGQRSQRLEEGV